MASRGSVRARLRESLTDELVLLVRRCGLLVHIMLATLVYKYLLKECLPGQYAVGTLITLYGLGVIRLIPGATSPQGFANLLAIAARILEFITFRAEQSNQRGTASRQPQQKLDLPNV